MKGSHEDKFINKKFFKSLNELADQIYEVEMSKTRSEHKWFSSWFFILQYARHTMLQLLRNNVGILLIIFGANSMRNVAHENPSICMLPLIREHMVISKKNFVVR